MSRRPLWSGKVLAALACTAPLLSPPLAHADTCVGLSLTALTPGAGNGTGTNPNAVAVGDFDRDGKMDVAVVNTGSDNVSILLGDGLGGFTAGPTVATGGASNPVDIAAGDLDRDGILDLVVAFGTAAQARVLQGTGTGNFTPSTPFPLNTIPSRIYLADFTNDADLDLVVLRETVPQRLVVYAGAVGTAFNPSALSDFDLSGAPAEAASGAAPIDFNRDGLLDLAVTMRSQSWVRVYRGLGTAGLGPAPTTLALASVGTGPRDVAAGDVNRDGWVDLVTVNDAGSATVLLNSSGTSFLAPSSMAVGSVPTRVALVDLDHDGVLDLAALDPTPRVSAFQGKKTGPAWFDAAAAAANLAPGVGVRGLGVGRFTPDGRADLVTTVDSTRQAVVVENRSGTPCARSSFAGAPRSYAAGDRPVSTAAADFDGDGRKDLAVVSTSDVSIRILRNANNDFVPLTVIGSLPSPPSAVATADLDADGDADLVVTRGDPGPGLVQVYLGDGMGGLSAGDLETFGVGSNPVAVVIGDFNGDGAPDVAAAFMGSNSVYVFLGDGLGGLAAGIQRTVGTAPRALVAGFFDADLNLDLAVANFGSNDVWVLGGNGNGTFAAVPVILAVGANPQGIAAADIDGDGRLDLATADFGSAQASVIRRDGLGGYLPAVPYTVGTQPTAVALLNLEGDPRPELIVATAAGSGIQTLTVLTNNGAGVFTTPSDHPVRNSPQAITPIDVDNDGLPDLAIPCSTSDAVVILIHRPPGPPVLSAAPRFAVGDKPRAAVAADLDGDGDLDLAVANSGSGTVSLRNGDGLGGFTVWPSHVAEGAEALAAADFNLDGRIDLAVSSPGAAPPQVKLLFGAGGGVFTPQTPVTVGGTPDDLVAGDFDLDGDVDLALCDKDLAGVVKILRNNGPGAGLGTFSVVAGASVGNKPTAIVAADFDRDGDLDLAVANDDSNDVMFLRNGPLGSFTVAQSFGLLGGDTSPVSLAAADFNADGLVDLAAASFDKDRLHVFRNLGASFDTTPGTLDAPAILQFVIAADVNLDAKPDLVAVAAGVSVFRGKGGMAFDPPQTVVAGHQPAAAVAADFNRDGRPDVVVVNEGSDDVSVLSSSACQAQHLELSLQPSACSLGAPPFFLDAQVKALDDGGNLASCATNTVMPSIVPGTGGAGAVLSDPVAPDVVALGLPLAGGLASFTGGNALAIDRPGRRYRLQFQASGLAPVHSRGFTLGLDATLIAGPASVCPSSSGNYSLMPDLDPNPHYDIYAWTLTPSGPPPFAYSPSVTLSNPTLTGAYTLAVTARVDACVVTPPARSIYFGTLASVTLDTPVGVSSVCVDCIGGSVKALEQGGGAVTRQWGYRTISTTGPITPILGETGEIYILKGTSFPGPGIYYVVVTTTPTCGTRTTSSNEWMVAVDNASLSGEVRHLAASSRGGPGPTSGENQLLWVNTTAPLDVRIRWNKAPDGTNNCLPPDSLTSPPNSPTTDETNIMAPAPNAKASFLHPSLVPNTAYCYSVFVRTAGGWSPGRTVKARPFDATTGPVNSVKWAYATGGTAVAPPTVSVEGILALSNDHTVHALTRGSAGGVWPTNWMPAELAGVAHSRSPVVPFVPPLLALHDTVLFVADDTGFLHSINAKTGVRPWLQGPSLAITGAPGGIFTQYGGVRDALFVGTRDNVMVNAFRAHDLTTGALLEAYAPAAFPGPIGPINGTPAIDYATRRIYFASHKRLGGDTLFCLEIGAGAPVFTYKWSRDLGKITGSPVLRGGRVYVGTDLPTARIYSLDAANGLIGDDRTFDPLDGPVKGFLFPDRRIGNDDLFFATDTKVWSISDDGASMTKNWEWTIPGLNPSVVLFWPQTDFVYVGSKNGELYELKFTNATTTIPPTFKLQVLGAPFGQVGAPSLDIGVTPKLLLVGSEPGVVYGVEVPFP